ncbi:hypothetical protein [Desulfurobacterium atlanticum]|uniref:Uncharacterized protein n=1 Tax=Desulfurobacterium atlanticum TaxID=240169 RepID=A0A238XKT9_9BACT|nr:hypothetical protein [Desulfurobacterium atlanticum]SNR59320.1 hypothetical protein SAMN06265340_10159 [Desulfurobacterium atlanticum]
MKRKGFVIVATLGIIAVLTIAGGIATYTVMQRTGTGHRTKKSVAALRIAQSGIETALTYVKSNRLSQLEKVDNNTYKLIGNIKNGNYTVIIKKKNDGSYLLTSTGYLNGNSRIVEVTIEPEGGALRSFAAGEMLTICDFINVGAPGSREWENETIFWAGEGFGFCNDKISIDGTSWNIKFVVGPDGTITEEMRQRLAPLFQDANSAFIPKVEDLNIAFPEYECDINNVEKIDSVSIATGPGRISYSYPAVYIKDGTYVKLEDKNGDGKIVLCNDGGPISIETSISSTDINDASLVIKTTGDIEVNANIGSLSSGGGNSNSDSVNISFISEEGDIKINDQIHIYATDEKLVSIIAKEGDIYLNSELQLSGKSENYQTFIYAGDKIISELSAPGSGEGTYLFDISGYASADLDQKSSVVLISKNGIDMGDNNFINISGREWLDLLVWSDGDINAGKIKYVANSGDEIRYIGFLTQGNLTLGDMFFSGREKRNGLTYEEIVEWCNYTESVNSPLSNVICELKKLIEKEGFENLNIKNWKEY